MSVFETVLAVRVDELEQARPARNSKTYAQRKRADLWKLRCALKEQELRDARVDLARCQRELARVSEKLANARCSLDVACRQSRNNEASQPEVCGGPRLTGKEDRT